MTESTVTLWRPVGPIEFDYIKKADFAEFPPRLPEQPIFYPVLNEEYAILIARDWNLKLDGAGYVTEFEVKKEFLDNYEIHQVGGRTILEYWIPAEELVLFNKNIVGKIRTVREYL